MKVTLAVLGLVLFVALAECMPADKPTLDLLKTRILKELAARGKHGHGRGTTPDPSDDEDAEGEDGEEDEEEQEGKHGHGRGTTPDPSDDEDAEGEDGEEDEEEQEGEGKHHGHERGTTPDPSDDEESGEHSSDFVWREFASLYAKCESGELLMGLLSKYAEDAEDAEEIQKALVSVGFKPEDSILFKSCDLVVSAGQKLIKANDEQRENAEPLLEKAFSLMHCASMYAEKESLELLLVLSGKDPKENDFLREASPLFMGCDEVFDDEELIQELEEAVEAEDTEGKRIIKQLINHFRK